MQDPAQDRRVLYNDAALGHHGHQVPIAQPIGDVPANTEFDDLSLEPAPTVDRVTRYCFWSFGQPPQWAPKSTFAPSMHQNLRTLEGLLIRQTVKTMACSVESRADVE